MDLIKYSQEYFEKWNKFVEESNNGTIFQRIDFLNYHGEKFAKNEHHLIWLKGGRLYAVMPMAIFEDGNRKIAKSPFGASYGGIISLEPFSYSESIKIINSLLDYLKDNNVDEIIITPTLNISQNNFSDTLSFSMLERGFKIINSDIVNCVNLVNKDVEAFYTSDTKRMIKKAKKYNFKIDSNPPLSDFWTLMTKTFSRHGTFPTHSFEEWEKLCAKFPQKIWNSVAYVEGIPVAGIGHIVQNSNVNSPFYFCMDDEFRHLQGLSLLVSFDINKSQEEGFKWYDVGTSSVNMKARPNIFRFKEGFGAIGVFRNTYMYTKI